MSEPRLEIFVTKIGTNARISETKKIITAKYHGRWRAPSTVALFETKDLRINLKFFIAQYMLSKKLAKTNNYL